jgi:hypothetical protein
MGEERRRLEEERERGREGESSEKKKPENEQVDNDVCESASLRGSQ